MEFVSLRLEAQPCCTKVDAEENQLQQQHIPSVYTNLSTCVATWSCDLKKSQAARGYVPVEGCSSLKGHVSSVLAPAGTSPGPCSPADVAESDSLSRNKLPNSCSWLRISSLIFGGSDCCCDALGDVLGSKAEALVVLRHRATGRLL